MIAAFLGAVFAVQTNVRAQQLDVQTLREELGMEGTVQDGQLKVTTHTPMVHDDPQVFFLHYWGTGAAEELARGLRQGLDQTGAR